ncbi:MAG: LacI family DNA-binding transcriptional regulator [Geminicoccaceae bacterium]
MRRGAVTIKDVAAAAGVHASTVSRALAATTRHLISPEIVDKIEKVALDLGYARNEIASSLRTRRSMTVGVLVPDITNPLFPPMLRGIQDELGADYTAIVTNTDNDPERESVSAKRLLARSVDGLILATVNRRDPLITELTAAGVAVVLVNRMLDRADVSAVVSDDANGIRLMVEHLVHLGHRRIAHLAGPQDLSTGIVRYRAFKDAMRAARLEIDERLVGMARGYSISEGARVAELLLRADPPPTALLTANDLLALGAYEAAAAQGLAIPTDLSITGFNDMPFVDRIAPPLTTIRVQHYEMGAQAAQLLLRQLERPDSPRTTVSLGVTLISRGSTAPPR